MTGYRARIDGMVLGFDGRARVRTLDKNMVTSHRNETTSRKNRCDCTKMWDETKGTAVEMWKKDTINALLGVDDDG